MVSPEYRNITVRMLLNHSAGFPGGDMRNGLTDAPFTGFAAQMMESLKYQRLKHAPGYLNVYSNDGFTMVENLVKAVTGLSYPEYVRQEILTPLQMTNSRYPDDYLPDGSYARPYTGETPQPYTSLNLYATGGLYSSAADMGKLMMMLINGGVSGTTANPFPRLHRSHGPGPDPGNIQSGAIRHGALRTRMGYGHAAGIEGRRNQGMAEGRLH